MGAGDLPAGDDLAGDGFELVVSRPRNVSPPAAILYDGASRDFPLDADGRPIEEHPTDQKVGLALIVVQGTVAGSSTLGSKLRNKRYINDTTIRTEITYIVNTALASLVAAKEIAIARVDVDVGESSRVLVRVVYENLLLNAALSKAERTRTQGVTFNG